METKKHRTLYICYFWLNESLVQTQVLPYLRELAKDGHEISLLTFERDFALNWTPEGMAETRRKLGAEGIDWYCLPYHKWPSLPATLYDIANGARLVNKIAKENKIDVFHARVHVPALMGALVKVWRGGKIKLLFDIRGFFPEEYVDAGVWKANGALFRGVKKIEKWLFKQSDAFVVLTEKAREILFPESKETGIDRLGRPVEVIPCCVDLSKFGDSNADTRNLIRQANGFEGRRVIVYVGSLGGWYLTEEMLDFFSAALRRDPASFALILTKNPQEQLSKSLRLRGFGENDYLIREVSHLDIPKFLRASDVAVSFIKSCYSKLSSSPTKIAEYLACGLPIIVNSGVGDIDELIENENIGAIIRSLDESSYIEALNRIAELTFEEGIAEKCRSVALRKFDLETIGGGQYRRIYAKLT